MSYENKYQEIYKMKVGDRDYIFEKVPLTHGAIGNWGISHETVVKMMKSVCVEILVNKDEVLSYDELQFLAKSAELRMGEIAELIGVDKSLLSKWKSGENKIQYLQSYCLKGKLPPLIFKDGDQRIFDTAKQAKGWRDRLGIPEPRQLRAS